MRRSVSTRLSGWLSGGSLSGCFSCGLLVLVLALSTAPGVRARDAAPLDSDPALEAHVMKIAEELRCLVCQNETLAASQADLAVDLRRQIRIKLSQGQTEQQILDFMVERYGAFVRYRPAFNSTTLLLWAGPFLLLVVAAGVLAVNIRRQRRGAAPAPLSDAEARRVAQLLQGDGGLPGGNVS